MESPTVVGLPGSLRAESTSRMALELALTGAKRAGGATDMIDLATLDLPVYSPDRDSLATERELTERIRSADAVIVSTPVYHGSYSSAVKNALDYCGFDEFENKTVGLLGVAGGSFPITALEHLRTVFRSLNAWVLPYQAAVPRAKSRFVDGELEHPDLHDRVEKLGAYVVQYAAIQHIEPPTFESTENVGADD